MKHICIIAATLSDCQILTPLIMEMLMDESLYLTVVSTGIHRTPEFDILYRRVEQEGFTIDEKTQVILNDPSVGRPAGPVHFGDLEYDSLFKQLNPDMIILFGEHPERVFNIGSLLAERVKTMTVLRKTGICSRKC